MKQRAPALDSCARGPSSTGQVKLRLVVDLTSDVYRADVVESTLAPAVSGCIARSLEAVAFGSAVTELTTVEAVVSSRAPAPR